MLNNAENFIGKEIKAWRREKPVLRAAASYTWKLKMAIYIGLQLYGCNAFTI